MPKKQKPKTKQKVGRKNKYITLKIADKLDIIKMWRKEGATEREIFERLGICEDSGYKYKKEFSEFSEALIESKDQLIAEIKDNLYRAALQTQKRKVVKRDEWHDGEKMEMVTISTEDFHDLKAIEMSLKRLDGNNFRKLDELIKEKDTHKKNVAVADLSEVEKFLEKIKNNHE